MKNGGLFVKDLSMNMCRFNQRKCRFKHHKRPFNHQIWLGKTSSKLNFNLEFLSSKSACFIMGSWHNTSTKGGTKIGDQQSQPQSQPGLVFCGAGKTLL